jgi:peptidoglycan/xylan/chitin deacetylase (PgdA/CDA1 family)
MRRFGFARTIFEILLVALLVISFVHPMSPGVFWRDNVVTRFPTKEKVAALTYDDGPHPTYTPELLDILDKYHVKATFFMIGQEMEKRPDIVKDVVARGHVIGNHTYTHPRDMEADTDAQLIRELELCEEVIERLTGKRAHLFRPPRGLIDGAVFTIAEEEGYRTILWTVCADNHNAPTPDLMAQRVLRLMRPGGIVLAHDGTFPSRWKDVEATPLIIEGLKKQGYRFVTIPELLRTARRP